jgi:hypothetical protein
MYKINCVAFVIVSAVIGTIAAIALTWVSGLNITVTQRLYDSTEVL